MGITFLPGFREANKMLPAPSSEPSGGEHDPGDASAERRPAATKAGGPGAGPGAAKTSVAAPHHASGNGARGPTNGASRKSNGAAHSATAVLDRLATDVAGSPSLRSEQFASFQTDAPSCDQCGAITVRNGNCYLCHNCGNSMGCS
jgi:ribonucleoside-diphosphate reductase alpha chain